MSRKMPDINEEDLTEASACIICSIPIFYVVGFVWGKRGWGRVEFEQVIRSSIQRK
jgi:hypothetical protein